MHTIKFTGASFRLPSLVILALIEAEIAGRGRICPPLSRARDSQTLSSARVKNSHQSPCPRRLRGCGTELLAGAYTCFEGNGAGILFYIRTVRFLSRGTRSNLPATAKPGTQSDSWAPVPTLTLAPLGAQRAPPCGFSQIAPKVLGVSL